MMAIVDGRAEGGGLADLQDPLVLSFCWQAFLAARPEQPGSFDSPDPQAAPAAAWGLS
jgi:hypothetical protein